MEHRRTEDDRPLPSTAVMLRAICSKEDIAEEEARKRIEKHYEGNQLINPQVAAYDYCVGHGIKDEDIESAASRLVAEVRSGFVTMLQHFCRDLWGIRNTAMNISRKSWRF